MVRQAPRSLKMGLGGENGDYTSQTATPGPWRVPRVGESPEWKQRGHPPRTRVMSTRVGCWRRGSSENMLGH